MPHPQLHTRPPSLSPADPDDAQRGAIRMRPFEPQDAAAFRELNEAWITTLFGMEEEDRRILGDPVRYVLGAGGHIWMAELDGESVGCCALVLMRPGVYEVAKMAVSEKVRGRGIGRMVLAYVIARARELGAHELELATNTRLANAVHLYESLGFRHLPAERIGTPAYTRANVFMEMHL